MNTIGRPPLPGKLTYMFISDHQIPYHDDRAIKLMYQVLRDVKPDKLFIVGDFIDFKPISTYAKDANTMSLKEEIELGRKYLLEHIMIAKEANPNVEIWWLFGNHEARMEKALARDADQFQDLEVDGELVNSIPHLFSLKKLGVKFQPYKTRYNLHNVSIEHGSFVSQKAGQTATKHMESRGVSVIHGHTHRLGLIYRRVGHIQQFGIELGCLCSLTPDYSFEPNWTQGFAIATYDKETKVLYPQLIPIISYTCMYGAKQYKG